MVFGHLLGKHSHGILIRRQGVRMKEYGTSSGSCPLVCFGVSFVHLSNPVTMCGVEVFIAVKMLMLF
jgi:hypothetical protein